MKSFGINIIDDQHRAAARKFIKDIQHLAYLKRGTEPPETVPGEFPGTPYESLHGKLGQLHRELQKDDVEAIEFVVHHRDEEDGEAGRPPR